MIWRLVLFLVVWFIIELIIVAAGGPETAVWLGLGERIVFMPLLLLLVIGLHRVMEGGEKMAEGDLGLIKLFAHVACSVKRMHNI